MKKILFAVMILISAFALVGCGGEDKPANLLSEKNVNDVLNDLRGAEDEAGYKIDGVDYGHKDNMHTCSALFDPAGRGSIAFVVTEKGSIIGATILVTDTVDFNLTTQANFVLVKFLTSIGLTRPEMENFLQEYNAYLSAEMQNQDGTITPKLDKVFTIKSSKLKKNVAVAVKGDENSRTYTVTLAQ